MEGDKRALRRISFNGDKEPANQRMINVRGHRSRLPNTGSTFTLHPRPQGYTMHKLGDRTMRKVALAISLAGFFVASSHAADAGRSYVELPKVGANPAP